MDLPDPVTTPSLPELVRADLALGRDWLGSWWPAVGALAVACALVAVAMLRRRRRRRAWPWLAWTVPTLVVTLMLSLNAHIGYVPNVSAARLLIGDHRLESHLDQGTVRDVTIPVASGLQLPESTTWIYLPPGYDPAAAIRYPVVYLIHGSPGASSDWFAGGDAPHTMDVLIAHHLVRPMIVVAPDVNGSSEDDTECLNSGSGGPQVETYLDDVVVPWVDANLSTEADWPHRVIGGMSAGGFCALDQGLRHPELFGSILALEPYQDPGDGGRRMLETAADFEAHSPGSYLPTMTFQHPVPTFLDIGQNARGGDGSETASLAAKLLARGQTVLFRAEPNQGHTWTFARTGLPYGLVFASEHLPDDSATP